MKQRNVLVSILAVVAFGFFVYVFVNGFPDFDIEELKKWLNVPISQLKIWELIAIIWILNIFSVK